jgi:hypothetical protein
MKILLTVLVIFSLGSCVEIIDDLSIKSDGSGTFKYTINLSSSKVKINSILALDSLDGKKVPSIAEIQEKVNFYKEKLGKKEGITNVKVDANYTEFIFKFQCDFTNIQTLQKSIKEIIREENAEWVNKDSDHNWLVWDGNKLTRTIPKLPTKAQERIKKEDTEALQKGSYISITRFDRPVEKFENTQAQMSANKMAVMIKTNPYSLSQNTELLENTIYLSGIKK